MTTSEQQLQTKTQPPATARSQTRTGKIARLPRAIRDELNRRLDDGESAATLLPWLNSDPDVQESLAARFDARPINAENLSHWRNGGYQDWLQHEEDLTFAQTILDESSALTSVTIVEDEVEPDDHENSPAGLPLSDRLSAVAALALAKIIRSLSRGNLESPESQKALLQAIRTLNWLRYSDHQAIRLKMDLLRWEEEKAALKRQARHRAALATVSQQPPPIESRIVRPSVPSVQTSRASGGASSPQPDPEEPERGGILRRSHSQIVAPHDCPQSSPPSHSPPISDLPLPTEDEELASIRAFLRTCRGGGHATPDSRSDQPKST